MADDIRVPTYLTVLVLDAKEQVLDSAEVVLSQPQFDSETKLEFDKATGLYVARKIKTGQAALQVSHDGFDSQQRQIILGEGENREAFVLADKGRETFFRGTARMPVTADPDLIGLKLRRQARDQEEEIALFAQSLGLEPQDTPEIARNLGILLFRAQSDGIEKVLESLTQKVESIEHAGRVLQMREDGFSFLTREAVVKFESSDIKNLRSIVQEHGFRMVRELVVADGAFVLEWQGNPAEILQGIEKLAARDDVSWAEPNLIITPVLDAITPTDTLWPGCWDRELIGMPDAWQAMQNASLDTYGDPNIVLAVYDSGTQSSGGVPTNPDFQGNVSNGQPKLLASFDFNNMVANNDNPWDDHGSGVAGVASARADGSGATIGVAGSAPNVQLITVASGGGSEVNTSDQYIWMAGFDPQSTTTGFPATPPPRGADVISCSLGLGAGALLSGIAQATLDFVTTFGRGGKGTMCFFSSGNGNSNIVANRPYGAYQKCFSMAASTFANDGTTEIRAPYSGWGQVEYCAPSHDSYPTLHNPNGKFATWSAAHQNQGNLPSSITTASTLATASSAGDTMIEVASTVGFAVNSVIHIGTIGAVGSEPARVIAVNAATNTLTVSGFLNGGFTSTLQNAHALNADVLTGPAGHKNNFGGTSSATPLTAGVAAMVLSADPSLTFVEAREIMRNTAVKLDTANTDATGQWLDINGNPSVTSGLPPVRSNWYGYGRVNAAAAVTQAIAGTGTRDLVIRDNLADTGTVAVSGHFWNSPDIWCRTSDPASDPTAFPANYNAAGPHQSPIRGQQNWACLRVRNTGSVASLDAWVRISIAHYPGTQFTYPSNWQPTNGPGDPLPSPMTPGTYFIGEARVTGLAAGADTTVVVPWPSGLIPPETVSTGSGTVSWHPCLLAEITPHDGPTPTGNHVWDDNNLAQKNISIVGTDATPGTDFQSAIVVGNQDNDAECVILEVLRGKLPRQVQLFVDLMDKRLIKKLAEHDKPEPNTLRANILSELSAQPQFLERTTLGETLVRESFGDRFSKLVLPEQVERRKHWQRGAHNGRQVIYLEPRHSVRVPVCAGPERLSAVVIGGIVHDDVEPGDYEVVVIQRQPDGRVSGSAGVMLRVGKRQG